MIPTPKQFEEVVKAKSEIRAIQLNELAKSYLEQIFADSSKGLLVNKIVPKNSLTHIVQILKTHGWLIDVHYRVSASTDGSHAQIVFLVEQFRDAS